MTSNPKKNFVSIGNVINKYRGEDTDKYISREFQKYGYELAESLGDMKHKSLYIKLAKETPRGLLEAAKRYVADADNARSKGSLFMWRLGQLKKIQEEKKTAK